jgi:hypothetical protein
MVNRGSSKPSKGVQPTGKEAPRQGPPANTKKWFENVQDQAKGKPPRHPN